MRTVVVVTDLLDTGANRVTLDRAVRWNAAGDQVTVFSVLREQVGQFAPLAPSLEIRHGNRRHRQLRSALPLALARLLRPARRADVVVAGTEVGFGLLLAAVAAALVRRPLAVTVHAPVDLAIDGNVEPRLRPVTRAAIRRAAVAVAVGAGLVPTLHALGMPHHRVALAANAVDQAAVRAAARAPLPIAVRTDLPMIVGSGRLAPEKGFDLLIRAHALALERSAPAHRLVVLGEGRERVALETLARELGVEASVSLVGFSHNPHAVVARSALFVLSSRWEGFPLALTEALAVGTPCLAFDCPSGPAEVLDRGRHGQLVPDQDLDALAAAIGAHLADPRPLCDRARNAAAAGLPMFDADAAAATHRRALADLVRPAG